MPADRLDSEKVVISAPMSFTGSAQRIWCLTTLDVAGAPIWGGILAVLLITVVWSLVLAWYCVFGICLVPYRILRRGSRKRKRQALQHREQLVAMERMHQQQVLQTAALLNQQQLAERPS